GNVSYTIVTAAAISADLAYNGMNPADVSVVNNNTDSGKYIFVTNTTRNGSFGGSLTADAACNGDSAKPRAGTYRAIIGHASFPVLSDPGPPAAYDEVAERDLFTDWVLQGNTRYYRGADSRLVGTTSVLGALPNTLVNSLHSSAVSYWTGLSSGASISTSCNASSIYPSSLGPTWASASSGRNGRVGDGASTSTTSISAGTQPCNVSLALLCAEQ
ncbi:MAG: DUF1554 domain-containing protein, partial [Turneriella sp.]|nr:DUF1554 domain-containing protein [Turneriella sp.]